jgi:hypothetical protein
MRQMISAQGNFWREENMILFLKKIWVQQRKSLIIKIIQHRKNKIKI